MTTTLRSVSALFALASLTAFGFGCSVQTGEEIGTSESAIARSEGTPVIDGNCPDGTHEVCDDVASGRLDKKSPKKNLLEPPVCTCVPDDEPPPPPSACPEGQHEETVCTDGPSGRLDKKSPKKNGLEKKSPKKNLIAPPDEDPPSCETVCVDDGPACPEGTELQTVCAPSAGGIRGISNSTPTEECWDECVAVE